MTKLIDIESGSSAPQLSAVRLGKVEKNLGFSFPQDYTDFLHDTNGGVPISKYFSLERNEKVVERILSIVDGYRDSPLGMYDVEVVWSQIEDRLDDSLVPFASVFAGDFLCFRFQGDSEPEIVLWDHERSRANMPTVLSVASSFKSFSRMLRE